MAPRKVPVIGIDLGTWKCCVGVVRGGKVEIIENERGSKTTPSYVAFTETERLVGEDAKDQVALNPTNTVFGVKRIIGRMFDDPDSKHHFKNFPFQAEKKHGPGSIEILVQYKGTEKWLPPEHITAMLLRKMKLTAEAYLGCPVQEAVVSVPVCFNSGQRQATLDAAEIAGLKVLQLLHEPTAVALAHKHEAGHKTLNQTVMVVDAGGGSLEVSVVSIKENAVKVLATSSDDQFGGLDLDQILLEDCVKKFQFGRECDLKRNKRAVERLRIACQKAKYSLSLLNDTVIFVDSLADGRDFKRPISREQFSQLFSERVNERINELLKGALQGANLSLREIDEVIVVGGSTRVPSILNNLQVFAGKKLKMSVNADEAVAHGAALHAALLTGDNTVADTRIFDVIPRTFVLEHEQVPWWFRKRGVIFHKYWSIPCERVWDVFVGGEGRQTLYLYECNKDSNKRSSFPTITYNFQFEGSWNLLRTVPVSFSIDENCLISAHPRPTGKHARIVFQQSSSNNTDLSKINKDEQSFQYDEQVEQGRVQAILKLESSCFEFKAAVNNWKTQYKGQKHVKDLDEKCGGLLKVCDDTVGRLDNNPDVDIGKLTKWQTQLEQRNNSLIDLIRTAPQPGEEIRKVPRSPKTNCFQCPREILQENSSLHSRASATHPDETRLQSRCNRRPLQTSSVKTNKPLQIDCILASSETHKETFISSDRRVEEVALTSIATSVPSGRSESNQNRTIVVDITKLDTKNTSSSMNNSNPYTVEREISLEPEINSPKATTNVEDSCGWSQTFYLIDVDERYSSCLTRKEAYDNSNLAVKNSGKQQQSNGILGSKGNKDSELAHRGLCFTNNGHTQGCVSARRDEELSINGEELRETNRPEATDTNSCTSTRRALRSVAERLKREGSKKKSDTFTMGSDLTAQATRNVSNDRTADAGSNPPNAITLSHTGTGSYLDGNGNLQRTEIHKDGSIDLSESANKPKNVLHASKLEGETASFTQEGFKEEESKQITSEHICIMHLQTGRPHERTALTNETCGFAQTQQQEAQFEQDEAQSQQHEFQSQLHKVQSQLQEAQSQQQEAQSQQQEAQSQQQEAQSQQQEAQSQQQEAQSEQQETQALHQETQVLHQETQALHQETQAQQQETQAQQQETPAQQQEAQFYQKKAQSQVEEAQSQQRGVQVQQQDSHSQLQEAQIEKKRSNKQKANISTTPGNTLQKSSKESVSNHTEGNVREATKQNVMPAESDKWSDQRKSQPVVDGCISSKESEAAPYQQRGKPDEQNSTLELRLNSTRQEQLQQASRPHVESQQNMSSPPGVIGLVKTPAIGIDLGTWKCCVGVVREGKVEIIENERGSKTTPSYVAFTETERLVGEDAKDQVALNPTNTVFGVKRIIGRMFDDQSLQNDMKFWPFTVRPDDLRRPRISVQYQRGEMDLSPELVSAMMLEKMKRIAEFHLGFEVSDAVISVPAYFNNSQRQATKDAGAIAGLNVLGLIDEPTAAALAYRDNKVGVEPHNVLIFDLGGGTFDVAVIRVNESGVKVEGVCGDAEFGGNEMDVLIMKRFQEELFEKHDKLLLQDKKGLERLRAASEKAKKTLTLLSKANVQVDSIFGDIDFNTSIKRHDFEQLYYTDAKERIEGVLKTVLQQAKILVSGIDEVVLVGGTSRIPKVQSILKEFFDGKALNKTVNPDEAVAHGAALLAALFAGDSEVKEVHVTELVEDSVTSHLRKQTTGDWFSRTQCSKDHKRIHIAGCLTHVEVTQLTKQVCQFDQDDQKLKEGVTAMSDLETLCFQTKALVTSSDLRQRLEQDELKRIADRCEAMICWLDDNDSAAKTEYEHKKSELCSQILSIMEKRHVKETDFVGVENKGFLEMLCVGSELPSYRASTHAHQEQFNSSGIPTLSTHSDQHQGPANSFQQLHPQQVQSNSYQTAACQRQLMCHQESELLRQAHMLERPSLQRADDPQIKAMDESKHKHAAESEGSRHSPKQKHGETEEKLSQLTKIDPPNCDPIVRQHDLGSHLFPCQSNRTDTSVCLFNSDNQPDTNNRISPCSPDSGICSPSAANEGPLKVVRTDDSIGPDFTGLRPGTPTFSFIHKPFVSSTKSLSGSSKTTSVNIMDASNDGCISSYPSERADIELRVEAKTQGIAVKKSVDSITKAQQMLICGLFNDACRDPASSLDSDRSLITSHISTLAKSNYYPQDSDAVGGQRSAPRCQDDDLKRGGDDYLTVMCRREFDQENNNDQLVGTTIPLWSRDDSLSFQGGCSPPSSTVFVNEKNAAWSREQGMDAFIKSLMTPSTAPNQGDNSNVAPAHMRCPAHRRSLLVTQDGQSFCTGVQRLRVTPTAINNDPDIDLSPNTKSSLNQINDSSVLPLGMKLPIIVSSPNTPSSAMVFSDRLRNYCGQSPSSCQPQAVHCNSTNALQQQPCATEDVHHSADHGPTGSSSAL